MAPIEDGLAHSRQAHISQTVFISTISDVFWWGPCCFTFYFWVLCYFVSLRVEPATISAYRRCCIRLYLQLFVGGFISYLRHLCLFVHSGVQHILCYGFVCLSLVFLLLPVSLDCLWCSYCCRCLWIVYGVPMVSLDCLLCSYCCRFLWIVYGVPIVAGVSGLSIFDYNLCYSLTFIN